MGITKPMETKLKRLLNNWINGNKESASKQVRALSKLELVYLLTHTFALDVTLAGKNEQRIKLENFLIDSLEGRYYG